MMSCWTEDSSYFWDSQERQASMAVARFDDALGWALPQSWLHILKKNPTKQNKTKNPFSNLFSL